MTLQKTGNRFIEAFFCGQHCDICGEQMERESKTYYVCKNSEIHKRLNPW